MLPGRKAAEANAARLISIDKITARVAQLQAKADEKTAITIKSLTDDLIRLRRLAEATRKSRRVEPLAPKLDHVSRQISERKAAKCAAMLGQSP